MIHLTVYGDGLQTRSFCHVSDEIEGVLALSQADEHLPTNIGNSREFTMLECAELVMEVTDPRTAFASDRFPGRSQATQARHRQGAPVTRLGAENRSGHGLLFSLECFRKAVQSPGAAVER